MSKFDPESFEGANLEDWVKRAKAAEVKLQEMELVVVCANDIVKAWPTLTLRMLGSMTNRIDTLRQALEQIER